MLFRSWYKNNVDVEVRQQSGYNSFVANTPLTEFQIDLFNFRSKIEGDEYTMGIACIDIFTKTATIIAIPNKQPETYLKALQQIFKLIGKPKVLMSDNEGSLNSKLVSAFLEKENIQYIINRNRCPFVERFIRTAKTMMRRRLMRRNEHWYNQIGRAHV